MAKRSIVAKHINTKTLGFTLIELLVVISIIGMLSSVVLASLNSARVKARDTKRAEDIRQIQTALEMYYNDNGQYPVSNGWAMSNPSSSCGLNYWSSFATAMSPYMATMPDDPLGGTSCPWTDTEGSSIYFNYAYRTINTAGTDYELVARLENSSNSNRCGKKCWLRRTTDANNGKSWCDGDVADACGTDHNNYSKRVYIGR